VENVTKSWGSNVAVRNANLSVADGEVVALLGGARSGKSTLLKMISADVKPDAGSVSVCGYDTVMQAGMVRPRIGVVHHEHFLEPGLSGRENLEEQALLRFLSEAEAEARLGELLPLCALGARLADAAKTYAPDEWMRLEIAACLIHRPQVLLVDEPSRGADAAGRARVWAALRAMRPQVRSVLLTTPDATEAEALADRVVTL
jgi:ABC-2 type transport system ATP-binding protein